MKRSNGRFLTTHMGGLSRPADLTTMLTAKDAGQPYDADALAKRVTGAVAEVVKLQAENGIDIVNDGELSKFSWAAYFADRLDGLERKPGQARAPITAREALVFPDWFKIAGAGGFSGAATPGRISARPATRRRRHRLTARLRGRAAEIHRPERRAGRHRQPQGRSAGLCRSKELYLTALAPVIAEYFITNEYYKTQEELSSPSPR